MWNLFQYKIILTRKLSSSFKGKTKKKREKTDKMRTNKKIQRKYKLSKDKKKEKKRYVVEFICCRGVLKSREQKNGKDPCIFWRVGCSSTDSKQERNRYFFFSLSLSLHLSFFLHLSLPPASFLSLFPFFKNPLYRYGLSRAFNTVKVGWYDALS